MSNNSFKIKNSAVLTPKDLSTLVSPEAGEIACDINDSNKIKRYDAASSSWVEVGSGGVGSVDIMFVQDFESSSLSSFTQTGLSLSTTNPLHGKVSALLTHQAAVNQSFKQVVAVDPKFRGQAMVLDLNIKSAASAGNVVIKVRDESNSADLIVSEALQLSSSVSGRRSSVSFTIPSTCSSLSYTITALPEAGSPVTRIDDIVSYLGDVALLETSVEVPVMTAWQGYTPTFQGFGTPSNVEFEWRQVGENVEIRSKFRTGTTTAVEARIGLPGGLTSASTSLIPSIQMVGSLQVGSIGGVGQAVGSSYAVLIEPSVSYITLSTRASSNAGLTKVNGNLIGVNEDVSFFASVPCAGLSATSTKTIPLTQSGLVQEGDGHYQLNNFTYRTASTATNTLYFNDGSIVANIGDHITKVSDSVNGDQFIATKTGTYSINVSVELGGTASGLYLVKNNTSATVASILASFYENGTNSVSNLSWSGYLVKGDIIRLIKAGAAATFAASDYNTIDIAYQGSLKQVSVSSDQKITIPTSELRFEGASARGTGSESAIVQFTSMAKLRGDAFTISNSNGTAITMTKAGMLSVSANLYDGTAGGYIYLSRNQTTRTSSQPLASETLQSNGCVSTGNASYLNLNWTGFVNVGDIIRVSSSVTPTTDATNNLNLSFQEQDIAVSVTNTLPQFSDSDSSVRLDTANGYGSTLNNKIRRFSNVRDNIGADIAYLDDSVNGATFTVKSSGIYSVSYTEQASSAAFFGLSKNSSQLTTSIISITTADRLAIGTTDSISGYPETISWQGYLQAGDVIRAHTEGALGSAGPDRSAFTISKVGKPNVTGVDVTPFVNLPQSEVEVLNISSSANGYGSSWTNNARFGTVSTTNKGILKYADSATNGALFTALKPCIISFSMSGPYLAAAASVYSLLKNQTSAVGGGTTIAVGDTPTNIACSFSADIKLEAGETLSLRYSSTSVVRTYESINFVATALSDQILTAPETFSTDTAALQYASSAAYTLSTLQNAPVGTFITFTYAANTNTRTQTTTAPTQTTADMNANGLLVYTRAYNAASTAAQPAAIAIQIGKGLKGRTLDLYKSAPRATSLSGSLDFYQPSAFTNAYGMRQKNYNESTGVLYLDAAFSGSSTTSSSFEFEDGTAQTSGYLVINASKSPALTGVPLLQPRIATLSDVKASGTQGGTATSGSYQTRTLNTLSDPTGIVTSLASNQFTLSAGTYYIEASAPHYGLNSQHRTKIRNVTDSIDAILGSNEYPSNSASVGVQTRSIVVGTIEITSSKVFELQHRVGITQATNGFGVSCAFGDNEVYSIVKIQKIK